VKLVILRWTRYVARNSNVILIGEDLGQQALGRRRRDNITMGPRQAGYKLNSHNKFQLFMVYYDAASSSEYIVSNSWMFGIQ
jgi:hypothetical protein